MKIRNRNGRIHAAFSAFDTVPWALGSGKFRTLIYRLYADKFNPLDNYWQAILAEVNLGRRAGFTAWNQSTFIHHSGGGFVGNIWNIPSYLIRNESGQSRTNDKDEHKTSDLLRHNKPDIDIGGCRNNGDRVCPARAGGKMGRQRIDIEHFDESEGD